GAENPNTTYPFYLGDEYLIRGYGYGSFTNNECAAAGGQTTPNALASCPAFDRLFGSKVAVVNTELRIPLFGVEGFGLVNFPFLPTEVSPFFDAGVAYTNNQNPDFSLTRNANTVPSSCSNLGNNPTLAQV